MGWEQRGARRYYYHKRREGRRVVSQYYGTGSVAALLAGLDADEQHERQRSREAERACRAAVDADPPHLDAMAALVAALTRTVLEANGYHQHKGQWRRKHGTQNTGG